ncbi:MAG TPA: SDR family NAD(P)-dependent oxidoreductase [Anaerolineae bacterium]|nr:SDR family NAD(P)-dependent oxidoreductase [Anaerolineae bacterium]
MHNKVALITGAGRHGGIGAAIAQRLAQAGVDVAIGDLCAPPPVGLPAPAIGQWDELQAIAAEVERGSVGDRPQQRTRCVPVKVDVTDPASLQAMLAQVMAEFGRVDILVNNAGAIFGPSPVAQMADDAWRRTLEVNATGVFLVTKAALPAMIQGQRGGRIVNMSSLAAIRPRPYMAAYAASKAAVAALTQSLAQEVAQFGITVNAVLPGDIDTGMKQWGYQLEALITQRPYDDVVAAGVARIPAGRLGTPEDVAGLVAYLASDEASFITGQLFPVTGGRELT